MAQCFHKKIAFVTDKGMVFKNPPVGAEKVFLPCGKCLACRVNKAAEWANRVIHETAYVDDGCFITLTYAPEHCPSDYQLRKKDLQDFMKRLRISLQRKSLGSIRSFLACGEYGDKRGRPHYHLLILGWCPSDLVFHHTSYSCMPVYTSEFLEKIWGLGFCPVGTLTNKSAGYVARYAKKAVGEVTSRVPPFVLSSRNIPLSNGEQGAIGAQWLLDNHALLSRGCLRHPVNPDVCIAIPDYYLKLLERWYPDELEACRAAMRGFAENQNGRFFSVDDCGKATVYYEGEPTLDECAEYIGCRVEDLSGLSDIEITNLLVERTRNEEDEQTKRLNKLRRGLHNEN